MTLSGELIIDPQAIVANWRALDALSPPHVETAAVVKADAYGCGAGTIGPALARAGVRTFFVALPAEGAALREAVGPAPAIYVLGGFARSEAPLFHASDLRPVLNSAEQLSAWTGSCPGAAAAVQLDTGMNRLGMEESETPPLPTDGSIRLVMSHLACADDPAHPLNRTQLEQFRRFAKRLGSTGAVFSLAATGGILLGSDFHFDLTRAGIGLYGGLPFKGARPAVQLSLPVLQVRDLAVGEVVGYGATWTARRPSRIATLSGGYADGLIRALGNRARAFHRGQPAPFVGRVSMDLVTLDVTDLPDLDSGDVVELLGPHQTIDQLAECAGTIGYEILTSLGTRYRRRYRDAGVGQI